jgi:methylisocitrate lyase
MCAKLRAAASARRDPAFVVIARTDARAGEGLAAAIDRARAYAAEGADMIFPEALESTDEFGRFAESLDVPLIANMTEFGKSPLLSASELHDLGYAAVLFPVTLFRLAMKAVERGLAELAATGTQTRLVEEMLTRAELYDLLNYADFDERDRRYFGGCSFSQ